MLLEKRNEEYEVDFIVKEGKEVREAIQVTYATSRENIPDRELRALAEAQKALGGEAKVITWDYEGEEEVKGVEITFIPLWKYLLKEWVPKYLLKEA